MRTLLRLKLTLSSTKMTSMSCSQDTSTKIKKRVLSNTWMIWEWSTKNSPTSVGLQRAQDTQLPNAAIQNNNGIMTKDHFTLRNIIKITIMIIIINQMTASAWTASTARWTSPSCKTPLTSDKAPVAQRVTNTLGPSWRLRDPEN